MVSPLLAANAPKLTAFLAEGKFPRMDRWQHQYAELWKWGGSSGSSSRLWGVLRKRLLQILRETVVVLTIVVFADPIYGAVMESFIGSDLAGRTEVVATYWVLIGLVCLVPIVAVWRNLSAVSMILEDYSKSAKDKTRSRLIPLIGILLRVGFLLLLGLWIWNLLPSDAPRMWILPIVLLVGTAVVVLGWRRMVRWHSQMEVAINESLSASETAGARRLFEDHKEAGWALNIEEVTLPDETTFGGRLLREINLRELTGCSVVGIDRQGYPLRVIRPDNQVFPGDRLMLLGRREQVAAARRLLSDSVGETFAHSEQKDFVLESIVVQPDDALAGKALRDLDWPRRFHVQVVALRRKESVIMPPDGTTCIEDGDTLLLLGRPDMIAKIASEVQGA
ncbi:MAG: hypothetical protein EA353_13725 [Puniceicoccaceae bacterium]|nr:MAG: hypothetical protein EA353_13725 [Puniceicoccaceae bacterium]